MKSLMRRIFSILLILAMVMSICPSAIYAADSNGECVLEIDFTQYAGKTWSEVKTDLGKKNITVSGDGGNILRTPTSNGIEVSATAKTVTATSSIGFGKFSFTPLNLATGKYVVDFEMMNGVNAREYRYQLHSQSDPGDYGGNTMTRLTLRSGTYIKAGYNASGSLSTYDVLSLSGSSKSTMAKNTGYAFRQVVNLDERSIDETWIKVGDGDYVQQTVKTVASGARLGFMLPGMRSSETAPMLGGVSLEGTKTGTAPQEGDLLYTIKKIKITKLPEPKPPASSINIDFTEYAGQDWEAVKKAIGEKHGIPGLITDGGAKVTRTVTENGVELRAADDNFMSNSASSIGFGSFNLDDMNLKDGRYIIDFEIIAGVPSKGFQYTMYSQADPGGEDAFGSTTMYVTNVRTKAYISTNYTPDLGSSSTNNIKAVGGSTTIVQPDSTYKFSNLLNLDARRFDELWLKINDGEMKQQTVPTVGTVLPYRVPGLRSSTVKPELNRIAFSATNNKTGSASVVTGDLIFTIKSFSITKAEPSSEIYELAKSYTTTQNSDGTKTIKAVLRNDNSTPINNVTAELSYFHDAELVSGEKTVSYDSIAGGESKVIYWTVKANSGSSRLFVYVNEDGKESSQNVGNIASGTAGWLSGDLHTHSYYSDGHSSIEDNFKKSKSLGMDFIIPSDHKNRKYPSTLEEPYTVDNREESLKQADAVGIIALWGQEYNDTKEPDKHVLFYNANSGKNYGELTVGEAFAEYKKDTENTGLIVAAHPFSDGVEPWKDYWDSEHLDGLEVWNGSYKVTGNQTVLAFSKWDELNRLGYRYIGTSGTDAHSVAYMATNYATVYAKEFSEAGINEAIANGHFYGSNGPMIDFRIGDAMMGDVLPEPDGVETVAVKISGEYSVPFDKVLLYKNGVVIDRKQFTNRERSFDYTVNVPVKSGDFLRMEAYGIESNGFTHSSARLSAAPFAFSNPIYFDGKLAESSEITALSDTILIPPEGAQPAAMQMSVANEASSVEWFLGDDYGDDVTIDANGVLRVASSTKAGTNIKVNALVDGDAVTKTISTALVNVDFDNMTASTGTGNFSKDFAIVDDAEGDYIVAGEAWNTEPSNVIYTLPGSLSASGRLVVETQIRKNEYATSKTGISMLSASDATWRFDVASNKLPGEWKTVRIIIDTDKKTQFMMIDGVPVTAEVEKAHAAPVARLQFTGMDIRSIKVYHVNDQIEPYRAKQNLYYAGGTVRKPTYVYVSESGIPDEVASIEWISSWHSDMKNPTVITEDFVPVYDNIGKYMQVNMYDSEGKVVLSTPIMLVENEDSSVGRIKLLELANNALTLEPDSDNVLNTGANSISVKIGYTPASSEEAQLVLAVYEGDVLKSAAVSSPDVVFNAGAEAVLEADVDVLIDGNSNKAVKVFLWNNKTLKPLFGGWTLD